MLNPCEIIARVACRCEIPSQDEKDIICDCYQLLGQERIYIYAKQKKILPFVANILSGLGIDTTFWGGIVTEYRTRNEAVTRHLGRIFDVFKENDIEKVFVTENFGALLASGVDKALFASGDVDIYADIIHKEQIYKCFKQLGYTYKERYSFRKLINTDFYNHEILNDGFYFGIAWNPLSRMKLPCFVEANDFVNWEKVWLYPNTSIQLPDINSLMYICLLHTSLHSFSRAPDLRLYVDIHNCNRVPIDWDKIITISIKDNTTVRVLTSCILAKKLLSVNIPDHVINYKELYEPRISKLLDLVYDKQNKSLRYEPRGIKVLMIEALCDDQSIANGIKNIIFPKQSWVKEVYVGPNGNVIAGYCKHMRNLF